MLFLIWNAYDRMKRIILLFQKHIIWLFLDWFRCVQPENVFGILLLVPDLLCSVVHQSYQNLIWYSCSLLPYDRISEGHLMMSYMTHNSKLTLWFRKTLILEHFSFTRPCSVKSQVCLFVCFAGWFGWLVSWFLNVAINMLFKLFL